LPSARSRFGGIAGQIGVIAGPALGGIIFSIEPVAVYITARRPLDRVARLDPRDEARSCASFVTDRAARDGTASSPASDSSCGTRMLLGAISLDLFAVLLGDSIALAPVFARSILPHRPDRPRTAAHPRPSVGRASSPR